MPLIKATRAPEGERRGHSGPLRVRDDTNPPWPGIIAGWDARCGCTWAPHQGVMQVKYRNTMCVLHGGLRHG